MKPQEKYLSKPFAGSSHTWALERLANIPVSARVLDIGPGSGVMGKALGEKGLNNLYAVEIDPDARDHVKSLYQEVHPSIDPFKGRTFDLILLLDVLEHIAEPEKFFSQLLPLLAPGGAVLVSVPSITHWSVRLPLLFGFFDYQKRGLLDRTHLQFFTYRRVSELAKSHPDLETISRSSSIEPVEFLLPEGVWNNELFRAVSRVRTMLAETLPGFFAYQHLIHLRRR